MLYAHKNAYCSLLNFISSIPNDFPAGIAVMTVIAGKIIRRITLHVHISWFVVYLVAPLTVFVYQLCELRVRSHFEKVWAKLGS